MATTEEKIKLNERILSNLLKAEGLMTKEEFEDRINYYLDYLIPLYKERNKK